MATFAGVAGYAAATSGELPVALPGSRPRAPAFVPSPTVALSEPSHVLLVNDRAEWWEFKQRYLLPEGRIVDTGNGGASHSEGQGWGMLLAVAFDDRPAFDRVLSWTRRTLARPGDALIAWRYRPDDTNPVADLNNATDGDLFAAAALARAGRQWGVPAYTTLASAMARDIAGLLVYQAGPRTVLLPGAAGFVRNGVVVVNPSYYAFGMLAELAAVFPSPVWDELRQEGSQMIEDGRFGSWSLPPDWLQVDCRTGGLSCAPGWPARFGYDAMRIPLHMAWGRMWDSATSQAFAAYWSAPRPYQPAWVDLKSGQVAGYPAAAGLRAVAKLALRRRAQEGGVPFPSIKAAPDYYAAALVLLARLAWAETRLPA